MPAETFLLFVLLAHRARSELFYNIALYKSATYLLLTSKMSSDMESVPDTSDWQKLNNIDCNSVIVIQC